MTDFNDTSLPHPSPEELLERLNKSDEKANENWDLLLRTQAEFENYKRRVQKDIEHAHKYAAERSIREFLEVSDSIEQSLAAARLEGANIKSIQTGLELTDKILHKVLEKLHLKQIDPTGKPFDPNLHEAISVEETADFPPNTVVRVFQKGYQLHERVIRPARVTVAKTKEGTS